MSTTSSRSFLTKLHSDDLGKLLLRLSIGGLMLLHGIHKVQHGVGGMVEMISSKGLPGAMAYGAYVGEVLAPICVILGFLTRLGGLLISFTMVMAIYLVHMADLGKLTAQGAWGVELQMLYLLGGLAIFFMGAGKFSVTRGKGALN